MPSNIMEMKAEVDSLERDLKRVKSKAESVKAELSSYILLLQKLGLPTEAEKMVHAIVTLGLSADRLAKSLQTAAAAGVLDVNFLTQGFAFGFIGVFDGASLLGDAGIAMDFKIRKMRD